MTWPFENDTSAIIKKLANRSMKTDKRSKAFLLLTIALSVCMIFFNRSNIRRRAGRI